MEFGHLTTAAGNRVGEQLADQWLLKELRRVDVLAAAYAALDKATGNEVTVHLVHEPLASIDGLASQFTGAARLAGSIPHPDVVRCVSEGTLSSGAPFVVLERAQGETVSELVARRPGRVPPTEALRVASDILSILAAAHAQGLIHGSLGPDQVLLTESGAVLVIGFGLRGLQLAAATHLDLEPTPDLIAFTPPELARSPQARATGSCDVWATAAILFYLLTGETVQKAASVDGLRVALGHQPPRSLRRLAPRTPQSLERVTLRGLALSPRERFASARSMRAAITQAMTLPEVTTLRALMTHLKAPSSSQTPISQRPTPTGNRPPSPGGSLSLSRYHPSPPPLSAPPLHPQIPLPSKSPPNSNGPTQQAEHVVLGPSGATPKTTSPTERAITLPALSHADLSPSSSRDGSLVKYLGRAWHARSVSEPTDAWVTRIGEITHVRLAAVHVPVTIQVLPWGLREGETDTWESDLGLLPFVHRLYGGGVRTLLIEEPLSPEEVRGLVALPFTVVESGPGGDVRCALWEVELGRVQLLLDEEIEMRGNQVQLAEARREVVALARFDTAFQLEDCWHSAKKRPRKEPPGVWRAQVQAAFRPFFSAGLTPQGLDERFRRQIAEVLESEATPSPTRIQRLQYHAQRVRHTLRQPPAPTRPERHDARVEVVASLCHLVELAGAQVSKRTVGEAVDALVSSLGHAREVGDETVEVSLLGEVLSVSGEPLRAGRAAHAAADGMAQVLAEQGASRIQFDTRVTRTAVEKLYEACTKSVQGNLEEGLLAARIDGVVIESAIRARQSTSRRKVSTSGLYCYASALVALRSYYDAVSEGTPPELRWVRRIAHGLVDSTRATNALCISALVMAPTHRDAAARSVHTALLALAAASKIGLSRAVMARIAVAALLKNAGTVVSPLASRTEHPGLLAALGLTVGGASPKLVSTATASFEASWLDHQEQLGALEETPLLTARLVHHAGRVVDALSVRDPKTPLEGLLEAIERPDGDRACQCAILATIGILPIGTVVELDNDAWAVVADPGYDLEQLDRPTVRLVTTDGGRAIERPTRAELFRTGSGGPQRVVRLVPSSYTRFNIARTFLD